MNFEENQENLQLLNHALTEVILPDGMIYQIPPNSFYILNGTYLNYKNRSELLTSFLISKEFSNPQGTVQGGIIAACFDETFGPLGVVTTRGPILTVDMNVQYVRPIQLEEKFFIKTQVISVARTTIYMQADAFNKCGKLLAKASTNQLIVR